MRKYLVLTALLFGACAHAEICPEKGGPTWVAATSRNFEVLTDFDADKAQQLTAELEEIHAALSALAFASSDPPREQVRVVIFKREGDYRESTGTKTMVLGDFRAGQLDPRPTMVMTGSFSSAIRLVLQHELTHVFVRHYLPHAPRWLNEGLALFWETMQLIPGMVVIGAPRQNFGVGAGELPPIETLISAGPQRDRRRVLAFYAGAWALVHILSTGAELPQERFVAFQEQIALGQDPAGAWNELVTSVDITALDGRYRSYFRDARIPIWKQPHRSPAPPSISLRALTAADAHLIHVRWGQRGRSPAVLDEIKEALQHDPLSAEAHLQLAIRSRTSSDTMQAERELDRAIDLAPDDPKFSLVKLTWLTAALERGEMARADDAQAVVDRIAKRARGAHALNLIAWYYAIRGDTQRGLPFANRSLDAEPGCWECLDTLALLKHQQGKSAEAAELQRRAIDLIPDFRPPPKSALDALEKYRDAAKAQGSQ